MLRLVVSALIGLIMFGGASPPEIVLENKLAKITDKLSLIRRHCDTIQELVTEVRIDLATKRARTYEPREPKSWDVEKEAGKDTNFGPGSNGGGGAGGSGGLGGNGLGGNDALVGMVG